MQPLSPSSSTSEDEGEEYTVILPIDRLCDKLFCDSLRYAIHWEEGAYINVHIYQYCLYHEFYMNWIGYSTNVNH